MKIVVRSQATYGNVLIYPVCETAKLLASLTGKKTLTKTAMGIIKKMGYEVEVQAPKLSE